MASLNKITLIGNLGRDPEVREYQGRKVANFSIAVNEKFTKSDGTPQDKTIWFRVSFWGNTAEIAEKYLKQGSAVYIEGRLSEPRIYKDKNGVDQVALEVLGQSMTMLGSASGTSQSNTSTNTQTDHETNRPPIEQSFPVDDNPTDDLPF